jgi:hypothetical protein
MILKIQLRAGLGIQDDVSHATHGFGVLWKWDWNIANYGVYVNWVLFN